MSQATTPRKRSQPRTARQHNAEHGVQDVRIVGYDIPQGDGGSGNSGAGGHSPPPAPPRTGRPREPMPKWFKLLLWGSLLMLLGALLSFLGETGRAREKREAEAS